MNVALTRARCSLLVLCNIVALAKVLLYIFLNITLWKMHSQYRIKKYNFQIMGVLNYIFLSWQNPHWKAFINHAQSSQQCVCSDKVFEARVEESNSAFDARRDWILDKWPKQCRTGLDLQSKKSVTDKASAEGCDRASVKRMKSAGLKDPKNLMSQPSTENHVTISAVQQAGALSSHGLHLQHISQENN